MERFRLSSVDVGSNPLSSQLLEVLKMETMMKVLRKRLVLPSVYVGRNHHFPAKRWSCASLPTSSIGIYTWILILTWWEKSTIFLPLWLKWEGLMRTTICNYWWEFHSWKAFHVFLSIFHAKISADNLYAFLKSEAFDLETLRTEPGFLNVQSSTIHLTSYGVIV